ncbi:hypothetical protein Leryth_000058 [Lithospermum erythrorhizon]|nr:hypothetical protein Leryth_000058 [Lithospermum erythrorhizon]
MSTLQMPTLDLEQGATTSSNDMKEEEKVCFSDSGDDDGSCCSQFYDCCISDSEILEVEVGSRRASSDLSVEIDNGGCEIKVVLEGVERDCRICHMGLESTSGENGVAIQLGCSCKDDLAAAHKNCAETWFKIKGNKTCEICNSIAINVVCPSNSETIQQRNETRSVVSINVTGQVTSASETRRCLNSHHFVNFLLSCMVFAFVISWLFHFDITS